MYENCFIAMQNREDIYNALCIYYRNKGDDRYLVTAYIVLEEYNHEYFGYRGPNLRFDCPKININANLNHVIEFGESLPEVDEVTYRRYLNLLFNELDSIYKNAVNKNSSDMECDFYYTRLMNCYDICKLNLVYGNKPEKLH